MVIKIFYIAILAILLIGYVRAVIGLLRSKNEEEKRIAWLLIGIAAGAIYLYSSFRDDCRNSYETGYSDGYESGYSSGVEDGAHGGSLDGLRDGRDGY